MYNIQYPDYAKDTKLNAQKILQVKEESDLTEKQIIAVSLASAYATRNIALIKEITNEALTILIDDEIATIKTVATIMAGNNIYYRYIHSIKNNEIKALPAGLRMQGLRSDKMSHADIELCGLATSAINNCGLCMSSHTDSLIKLGINEATIQHTVQIAAVIGATAQTFTLEERSN